MITTLLSALLLPQALATPTGAEELPIGPDRFLAEVISDLSHATGASVRVGIAGDGGAMLVRDIERRLEPGVARFQSAWDDAGARAAARAWLEHGEDCAAVIRRVDQGWEYTTWGECPSSFARPDEAYAASLLSSEAALQGQHTARRSVWLSVTSHLDVLGGQACLNQQVENPNPPPATITRSTCWEGPVGVDMYAGGVELGWVKREADRRLARDVRIELGAFTGSGMPLFSPSLGGRYWVGQDWLYVGARAKLLYLYPGAVATVGATLGQRAPLNLELGVQAGGVSFAGPSVTAAVGGVFGDR